MRTKPKTKIDIGEVERLAGLGLSKAQICASLGFCEKTLYNHQKENTEITDAIKRGKASRLAVVSNKLQELIEQGNLGAIIFYLKTQGGFVETQRQLLVDDSEKPLSAGLKAFYEQFEIAQKG